MEGFYPHMHHYHILLPARAAADWTSFDFDDTHGPRRGSWGRWGLGRGAI